MTVDKAAQLFQEAADRLRQALLLGGPPSAQGNIQLGAIQKWGIEIRSSFVTTSSPGGFGQPVVSALDIADRLGPRIWTLDLPMKKKWVVEEGDLLVSLSAPFPSMVATGWHVGAMLGRGVACIHVEESPMIKVDWIMAFLRSESFRQQMASHFGSSAGFGAAHLKKVEMPVPVWGHQHDAERTLVELNEIAAVVAAAVSTWAAWDANLADAIQSQPGDM